jgi:preprotein translocase subunit YajC
MMTAVYLLGANPPPKSGGAGLLPILVVIGAAFYFLIYRPQQKKQKAAREASNAYVVGDDVVTAGGIIGRVLEIDGDRVTLETGIGNSFEVLRPYVLRKLEVTPPPTEPPATEQPVADADGQATVADAPEGGSTTADQDASGPDEGPNGPNAAG